jgi:hypothetical protein
VASIRAIVTSANRVLEVLDSANHLRDAASGIGKTYDAITKAAAVEALGHSGENYNKLSSAIDAAAKVIDSLDVDEVFGDVRELRRRLAEAGEYSPILTGPAQEQLIHEIVRFNNALKGFLKHNKNRHETMLCVLAAHDLHILMTMTESTIRTSRDLLNEGLELADGFDKLELSFSSTPSLPNVQHKLAIVRELYIEALAVVGDLDDGSSLVVHRLEEGSTFLVLIGKLLGIRIVAEALKTAARLGHGHLTRDGQIGVVLKDTAAHRELVAFHDFLRDHGSVSPVAETMLQEAGDHLLQKGASLLMSESYFATDDLHVTMTEPVAALPPAKPVRRLRPGGHRGGAAE